MDNELFLKKLSEVAEWHRPQTGPQGFPSVKRGTEKTNVPKPEPVTEAELDAMSDAEVEAYYDQLIKWRESQPNDSVPPEIVKLKAPNKPCEDCGKELTEHRRVECKRYDSSGGHWRTRCVNCTNYQNPLTKEFNISQGASHQFFIDFYRPKQGKYNSKYQPKAKVSAEFDIDQKRQTLRTYTVVETETSIIRTLDSESNS